MCFKKKVSSYNKTLKTSKLFVPDVYHGFIFVSMFIRLNHETLAPEIMDSHENANLVLLNKQCCPLWRTLWLHWIFIVQRWFNKWIRNINLMHFIHSVDTIQVILDNVFDHKLFLEHWIKIKVEVFYWCTNAVGRKLVAWICWHGLGPHVLLERKHYSKT